MEHYAVERVADGVFAAIATPGGGGFGNAAIVELGGETLVFDTGMTPQAGAELLGAAEEIGPVSCVVNSHWHGDHVRGNQSFGEVEIVATRRTRELIETRGAERLTEHQSIDGPAYIASLPEGPDRESAREIGKTIHETVLRSPTRVFDEERLELAPGCLLLTYGGGHTESDAFLWLPERGVVLMGDLLVVRLHPWMGDGDPERWIEILARVEELGTASFVPGHGPVASAADVRELREHIEAFVADPDAIEERYPGWSFRMLSANRYFLRQRAA
jgi:cyclase